MTIEPRFKFQTIDAKPLRETIVSALEAPILNGTFKIGEKLPSEEQLALQLGIGRRLVRESLKVLETKGLVDVQMGIGAVVIRNDLDNFLGALSQNVHSYFKLRKADAQHVMELRLMLEQSALEALTRNPDEACCQRLAHTIAKQREAYDANDFEAYQIWHLKFHHGIIDSLNNPVISMVYKQVMDLMRGPMERTGSLPAHASRSIKGHEQLVEAARRGDVDGVQQAIRKHLKDSFTAMQNAENK